MAAGPNQPTKPTNAKHIPSKSSIIEFVSRHELTPYNQGRLDGLCGLYSALNAIQLALPPDGALANAQATRLFQKGVGYIARKCSLQSVLTKGMSTKRWRKLLRFLARHADGAKYSLLIEYPPRTDEPTVEALFEWIEASLLTGKPVLICLENRLNHFSVVAGLDDRRLHFFDSHGLRYVFRSSCGIGERLHHISRIGIMRLAAYPTGTIPPLPVVRP